VKCPGDRALGYTPRENGADLLQRAQEQLGIAQIELGVVYKRYENFEKSTGKCFGLNSVCL